MTKTKGRGEKKSMWGYKNRHGLHGLTRFLVYANINFIRAIRVIRAKKINIRDRVSS